MASSPAPSKTSEAPSPGDGSSPEPTSARFAALVVVAAFLVWLPGLFWGLPGGKTIVGAMHILEGQVPYRDFWTMYAPGQFYLAAAVMALLGDEVVYQGAVALVIKSGAMAALYLLLRELGVARVWSAAVVGIMVLALWSAAPTIITYQPALLLLLTTLILVVRYYRNGQPSSLVWAGVAAGLAACFKHDVAFYVVFATTVGLFASWFLTASRRPSHWIPPWWATLRLAAGTMVFFLPVAVYIAWQAGPDVWEDLIVFPATDFAGVRGESYEPLLPRVLPIRNWLAAPTDLGAASAAVDSLALWAVCYLPIYVGLASLAVMAARWRSLPPARLAAGLTLVATLPFFVAAAHVQKNTHLDSMAIVSFLLVGCLWSSARSDLPEDRRRVLRRLIAVGGAVYALCLVFPFFGRVSTIARALPESRTLPLDGVRFTRIPRAQYEVVVPIATFLRENTLPDERIYVGVRRHEAIIINEPAFYYLADRLSCCRYSELHPGITDRRAQQEEIIRDLERHDVRALVIWDFGWADEYLDELLADKVAAVPGTDSTLLDEYIRRNYRTILTHGEHRVLWRHDAPGPSLAMRDERTEA